MKNTLVILGHPNADSYCAALSAAYADETRQVGHACEVLRLGDLSFDPILRWNGKDTQTQEADLIKAKEMITRAQHIVFVYPIWWGTMPALLKGFIDRVFLPGFAFKFHEKGSGWDKLLSGRTSELIITMDTPIWVYSLIMRGLGHRQMKHRILEFCGIKVKDITLLGPIRSSDAPKRSAWLDIVRQKARNLGSDYQKIDRARH